MRQPAFQSLHLPGSVEDAGYTYGKACAPLLEHARVESYFSELGLITKTLREDVPAFAARWASTLPAHYQSQINAFAAGARVTPELVQQWLYADIAAPSRPINSARSTNSGPAQLISASGPMCSGIICFDALQAPCVARNCDWYEATLARGTAAVHHAVPGRVPIVSVGLMGDIDCDTGLNAAGLWLHMHTLQATDEPRAGVSCISWLFWMREALETCENLTELEAFITRTDRDRGVLLFAAHGPTGEAAIYECSRASFRRVHPWIVPTQVGPQRVAFATNHCQHKHPVACDTLYTAPVQPSHATQVSQSAPRISPSNGTVSRYNRLASLLTYAYPEHAPDDLVELLADERVEMRVASNASNLRTIYSAVAQPREGVVWFASDSCPAASTGMWRRIALR